MEKIKVITFNKTSMNKDKNMDIFNIIKSIEKGKGKTTLEEVAYTEIRTRLNIIHTIGKLSVATDVFVEISELPNNKFSYSIEDYDGATYYIEGIEISKEKFNKHLEEMGIMYKIDIDIYKFKIENIIENLPIIKKLGLKY